MSSTKFNENYSIKFVVGSNSIQIAIYLLGTYLVSLLGPIWVILYLLYIAILEIRLLKKSCIHCYYYDKLCAFGKGKLCALFFKKGISRRFIEKQVNWKDVIPDFLVTIIPLIIGIYLLIQEFNWFVLLLVILLIILAFPVNGFLRGALACKYCKQREIGCPAEQIFNKKKTKENK